jgi:hypothetical protein
MRRLTICLDGICMRVGVGSRRRKAPNRFPYEIGSYSGFSTGNEQRDGDVKGENFLDVANHPTMTYRTTAIHLVPARPSFARCGRQRWPRGWWC